MSHIHWIAFLRTFVKLALFCSGYIIAMTVGIFIKEDKQDCKVFAFWLSSFLLIIAVFL